MTEHYIGRLDSQYKGSARLRRMGCTPQSVANGLRTATGGKLDLTGDQVLAKVAISEETNPLTAGWSLEDAALAMTRIPGAPPLIIRVGPWSDVLGWLAAGYVVLQQGDSEEFLAGCSGAFDGDHCIAMHVDQLAGGNRLIGDPICTNWHPERDERLEAYATNLFGVRIKYGVIDRQVPLVDVTPPDTAGGGMTLIEGRPIGSVYIPAGARFIPLDGKPAGVFPTERRQEFVAEGYNAALNARGIVVGTGDTEFAFVPSGYSDLVWYDLRPNPPTPPTTDANAAYNEGLAAGETAVHNLPRR